MCVYNQLEGGTHGTRRKPQDPESDSLLVYVPRYYSHVLDLPCTGSDWPPISPTRNRLRHSEQQVIVCLLE